MRDSGHHDHAVQADDLERKSERALRQAGLTHAVVTSSHAYKERGSAAQFLTENLSPMAVATAAKTQNAS